MRDLTARQQEILTLIQTHIAETGFPPTRADIAQALGFRSPNAAEEHLTALARKGVIELTSGASRGIRLKLLSVLHQDTERADLPSAVQLALKRKAGLFSSVFGLDIVVEAAATPPPSHG